METLMLIRCFIVVKNVGKLFKSLDALSNQERLLKCYIPMRVRASRLSINLIILFCVGCRLFLKQWDKQLYKTGQA
jgi:hypothetical protein